MTVQVLIAIMIFAGSALMVFNVFRYGLFVKMTVPQEHTGKRKALLILPLLLLIFFLIGYVVVGALGIADLLIAGIFLGGSLFVFMLLMVMFSIINHIKETDRVLSLRYYEMQAQVRALTKDNMSVFLVNLTKDEIEERAGDSLYESDLKQDTYTGMIAARSENVVGMADAEKEHTVFRREELLRLYQEGQTRTSEILLVRRADGEVGFVNFTAVLTGMPLSGDVMAMITEEPYNEKVMERHLLERVLMGEYDRIAYLIDGKYRVLISNDGKKEGLLLPPDRESTYESIYLNYILPAWPKDRSRNAGPNPLRLSVIEKALSEKDVYDVNLPFIINGERRYKHIVFYLVDRTAKIYLMLLTDAAGATEDAERKPEPACETGQDAAGESEPPKEDEIQGIPETEPAAGEPEANEPVENTPEPESQESDEAESALRLNILLVDDNEINREIGELILTSEGWSVELAVNGKEAVEKVENAEPGAFDLVLMDVQMPVMNGYEATAAIRSLPDQKKSTVPIIAVTANAFAEDVKAALDAGMDGHVAKPIDPKTVKKAISDVLAARRRNDSAAGG